jgi:CRP-like cAMP-binding protein
MILSKIASNSVRNRVLGSLSQADFDIVRPFLQPVNLRERMVLQDPGRKVDQVTFIETGVISMMTLAAGSVLENAMVGHQGFVGVSVVLGTRTSAHRSLVLVPGSAFSITADNLAQCMCKRPQIREHLIRYVESLMIHNTQIALCGVRHSLEQRLACWLCLACDALGGTVLPITHDGLSTILGLRRASVTEGLIRFEELGLVRKTRGLLQVCDRDSLQQKACCCYGVIARAYDWTNQSCARLEPVIMGSQMAAAPSPHYVLDLPDLG